MANGYIQEQPKSNQRNQDFFSQSWSHRWYSLLDTMRSEWQTQMEMHFVAAGVLLTKVMPVYTPLELQLQASSHLVIFKGQWKDVANTSLALNELLQCIIM